MSGSTDDSSSIDYSKIGGGRTPLEHRKPIRPAEWIADLSVSESEAVRWAFVDVPEENHRLGGYWFPIGEETVEHQSIGDIVASKSDITGRCLIHFPRDDRVPEMANGSDVPGWVVPRHVDAPAPWATKEVDDDDE